MLWLVESDPLRTLRRGMLVLVAVGTFGIGVELLVLEHYGDANQLIPLVVSGAGLLAATWIGLAPGMRALRVWQFTMLIFVGAGVTGITMHADVVSETVNPPLLAPSLFIHLGLLGLLYTFRHPAVGERPDIHA